MLKILTELKLLNLLKVLTHYDQQKVKKLFQDSSSDTWKKKI